MPAKLQVYEDSKSAGKGKSLVYEIFFTEVQYVDSTEERHKKVVTIGLQRDKVFTFYVADSHTSTTKWFNYCGLLFAIPYYTIPEVPDENLILQKSIHHCKDHHKSGMKVIINYKLCQLTVMDSNLHVYMKLSQYLLQLKCL